MVANRGKPKRGQSTKVARKRGKTRPLSARLVEAEGERLKLEGRLKLRRLRAEVRAMKEELMGQVESSE